MANQEEAAQPGNGHAVSTASPCPPERELADFASRHGVALACIYQFGSTTLGVAGPMSDCDIGLLFHASVVPGRRFEIATALIAQFQRIEGLPLDVTILNEASPALCDSVIRNGRCILSTDETARVAFEARTLTEFLDFRWALDRYDRALLERAREGRFANR